VYSLIVTAKEGTWDGKRYVLPQGRFAEYTDDSLKARYRILDDQAIAELMSLPTLFAYEEPKDIPARVGRVTRITSRGGQVKLDFELLKEVPAIPAAQLAEMAFDLDIDGWEMNRTHWAIKDVGLIELLEEASFIQPHVMRARFSKVDGHSDTKLRSEVLVAPTVFSPHSIEAEPALVAVMMPLSKEFEDVHQSIQAACQEAGLRCKRADDIWEDSTIIQDVVNLIYRSAVVVVDFSGRNPNVMYETGIAHTLGRPVVPISQTPCDLPFDLIHHRTLNYLANEQGLRAMTKKLGRRLRQLTS